MDRRDSLGVCVDSQRGSESLQGDQAVCISTNGTLTRSSSSSPVRLIPHLLISASPSLTSPLVHLSLRKKFVFPSLNEIIIYSPDDLKHFSDKHTPSNFTQTLSNAVCPCSGAVFVNGKEMTNQLPAITLGSTVTFDMEVVNLFPVSNNNHLSEGGSCKLRVTIGSGNREVVFDWLVDQAVDCLFFGCSFVHSGWKVLVF